MENPNEVSVVAMGVDGKVEVEVTGGRVSRLFVDPYWRAEAAEQQIQAALTATVNEAIDRFREALASQEPPATGGIAQEIRRLVTEVETF